MAFRRLERTAEPGEAMFVDYLSTMRADQVRRWGHDPEVLTDEELAGHLRTMGLALLVEAAELVEETQWKPWKEASGMFPIRNDLRRVAEEGVDVLHFLAHILVACGVDDAYLNEVMQDKRRINEERRSGEYKYD